MKMRVAHMKLDRMLGRGPAGAGGARPGAEKRRGLRPRCRTFSRKAAAERIFKSGTFRYVQPVYFPQQQYGRQAFRGTRVRPAIPSS